MVGKCLCGRGRKMREVEWQSIGVSPFQCGLMTRGIWVMQENHESRVATTRMMLAQRNALAERGAGRREQSAGIRALLECQA